VGAGLRQAQPERSLKSVMIYGNINRPWRNSQEKRRYQAAFWLLVPLAGIELATFALRMRCSTN
jgi:hypothetical protein